MRKITCLAAVVTMLLMATPTQAQFSWGIKGGVNLGSKDLAMYKDKDMILNVDNYTGFFIGPKAEIRVPILGFGVEAAALYAQKDMSLTKSESFKQNSFQIPLNIKYSFGLGNIANIFIAAGPEFGFNVGNTQEFVSTLKFGDDGKATEGAVQGYVAKKSTLSINLGVGATLLKHVQVGVNYNMPWGKTGDFVYIEASEIENAENIKNGENLTLDNVKTLTGTADKAKNIYNNVMSGTIQVSVAYLF